MLKHVRNITAILNPTVNSYKRLVPGYEAPVYLAWSLANRSALLRVPAKRGNATRVELRSPDPACNPYLAFAAILEACLDGVRNKIDPPAPVESNIYKLTTKERKNKELMRFREAWQRLLNKWTNLLLQELLLVNTLLMSLCLQREKNGILSELMFPSGKLTGILKDINKLKEALRASFFIF